ncbi:hypothetical protein NM688_g3991 [Phlebia brevispora]|uniref:Uncharacterized protein n=1 Tax=Phlebia brevispora TaxID=194682 RepID=A0ACC1T401_9APHY|nr:hypothetical protein NM688_g3991 [Phlebia brevispora]
MSAESAHFTYNFETAFVVVGSNAHQDDKNAAVHETEFLQGLFQRTTRSRDASEFMGHARAQTLMGLSQRTVEENFGDAKYPGASNASTSPSKATHSSSHESNATSSAKPVESGAELRGTACKNSEELWLTATTEEVAQLSDEEALAFIKVRFDHLLASHCITQSRSSAKQAVKNVPWQTLPGKLIDWGVRLLNWPNGVRCPGAGDSSSRKGISTLNKEERRTLAMAFIDPVRPIQMEKIQKKQEKGEYIVVIDSVAPPADSADDSGVRIQVLQRDHRVVKATRGLPRLCPTTPPPRNAGTQSSKEAGVPAKRSIQSEDEEEIEVLDTPTPRPRKMPRLDGNAAKQGSTMDLLEPDDDRDSENGPEPHNPPSRDASRSQKPVVELPLCPKGKEKPKSIEQEKSSNLRVYRPMPDLDLIAPMIRGTTHTVKPRPIVRKSQASLPSVSQQDNGSKVAATSEVADNHAGQPTFAPEQAIPITSKKDNHSTNGQTGLSTDAPSIALASTLCEGQPFEQARSGHSQTLHPLATTSGYPAATNVPIPPQFLTFMQQLLQAQQRSAPSGGPFISNPHTNVPPLFPPLGASGDVPRLPFGSTPTLRNESGPFGQPALPGPSNRSNSSDQTLPLPGGSVQSQVQPQSNTQQP